MLKDNEERNRMVLRRNISNLKSVASRNIKPEVSPDYTHIYRKQEELMNETLKDARSRQDPIVVHPDAHYNVFHLRQNISDLVREDQVLDQGIGAVKQT